MHFLTVMLVLLAVAVYSCQAQYPITRWQRDPLDDDQLPRRFDAVPGMTSPVENALEALAVLLRVFNPAVAASLAPSPPSLLAHSPALSTPSARITGTSRTASPQSLKAVIAQAADLPKRRWHQNLAAILRGGSSVRMEQDMPSLRFLGDARLMKVQPLMPRADIGGDACHEIVQVLGDAMNHYGGIGIAAPQIGLWTRVFVFGINGTNSRYPAAEAIPFQVWINPEITWSSTETNWMWEGCLSVPGLRGWVERPSAVRLKGFDQNGSEREVELDGLAARVAQHELDHLDGVLFLQRTPGTQFIVPQASMDAREGWGEDWPSPGSRRTGLGKLSDDM